MYTRQDYLSHKVTHRQYYGQFVNDEVKQHLLFNISKKELLHSNDEHLNDIALKRWDLLGGFAFSKTNGEMLLRPTSIEPVDIKLIREAKEGVSSSTLVCIYKEAARQIIEQNPYSIDQVSNV